MSDKQREASELRAILVSTRAALRHGDRGVVKDRSDNLLANLESTTAPSDANGARQRYSGLTHNWPINNFDLHRRCVD